MTQSADGPPFSFLLPERFPPPLHCRFDPEFDYLDSAPFRVFIHPSIHPEGLEFITRSVPSTPTPSRAPPSPSCPPTNQHSFPCRQDDSQGRQERTRVDQNTRWYPPLIPSVARQRHRTYLHLYLQGVPAVRRRPAGAYTILPNSNALLTLGSPTVAHKHDGTIWYRACCGLRAVAGTRAYAIAGEYTPNGDHGGRYVAGLSFRTGMSASVC